MVHKYYFMSVKLLFLCIFLHYISFIQEIGTKDVFCDRQLVPKCLYTILNEFFAKVSVMCSHNIDSSLESFFKRLNDS